MKRKELIQAVKELNNAQPDDVAAPPVVTESERLAAQLTALSEKLNRYRRVQALAAARAAAYEESDPELTDPAGDFEACDVWSVAGDRLMFLAERMARKCRQTETKLEITRQQHVIALQNEKNQNLGALIARYRWLEANQDAVPPYDAYYSMHPHEYKAEKAREMAALREQIDAARGVIDSGAAVRAGLNRP